MNWPTCCYKLRVYRDFMSINQLMRTWEQASGKCNMPHLSAEIVASRFTPASNITAACQCHQPNINHHHTCWTSAPVASHSAEIELIEEIRCARNALAVSLDSSADHRLAHKMRSSGIQCSYTLFRTFTALLPLSVSFPPMRTCRWQMQCEVS